jgi:hypothetical protein
MFVADKRFEDYLPQPASLFRPSRIVLAKGSNRTEGRRRLAAKICAAYPDVRACHPSRSKRCGNAYQTASQVIEDAPLIVSISLASHWRASWTIGSLQ